VELGRETFPVAHKRPSKRLKPQSPTDSGDRRPRFSVQMHEHEWGRPVCSGNAQLCKVDHQVDPVSRVASAAEIKSGSAYARMSRLLARGRG
jgi:hypothetical protein